MGFILLALISCNAANVTKSDMPSSFDKQGHRGCRGLMPENTLAAMLKAIDLGVTTLEMDVCVTGDGEAILSHEPFFNHDITTLPNGKYIELKEEKQFNIYQMKYAETQRFDVGLKPHPKFPQQEKMAATKPRLADVIDAVEKYTKDKKLRPVFYNIETKTQPLTDNIFHPEPATFVTLLMKVIKEKKLEGRTIIQSFDIRTLQALSHGYPTIKTALLIEGYDTRTLQEQMNALGFTPTIYSPAFQLVTAALVAECHRFNMKVIPWTVNDRTKINELKQLGVDGIITDYPNLFNQ
jgi:glycerophosphoryl diester phosphodiesterase